MTRTSISLFVILFSVFSFAKDAKKVYSGVNNKLNLEYQVEAKDCSDKMAEYYTEKSNNSIQDQLLVEQPQKSAEIVFENRNTTDDCYLKVTYRIPNNYDYAKINGSVRAPASFGKPQVVK